MLGKPASAAAIMRQDINIMPDGHGLPQGSGSVSQGRQVYIEKCSICHGPNGVGGSADQLAGVTTKLTDAWPEKTIGNYWPYATTLFDMIRRSMPMTAPGSLSDDAVYAVVAYLLYLNRIISENAVMDADSLPKVVMPNQDGFIKLYHQTN